MVKQYKRIPKNGDFVSKCYDIDMSSYHAETRMDKKNLYISLEIRSQWKGGCKFTGSVKLAQFSSNRNIKGYQRRKGEALEVLRDQIDFLRDKDVIQGDFEFYLFADASIAGRAGKNKNQKKLEEYYESMGFVREGTFAYGCQKMTTTVERFLICCKSYSRKCSCCRKTIHNIIDVPQTETQLEDRCIMKCKSIRGKAESDLHGVLQSHLAYINKKNKIVGFQQETLNERKNSKNYCLNCAMQREGEKPHRRSRSIYGRELLKMNSKAVDSIAPYYDDSMFYIDNIIGVIEAVNKIKRCFLQWRINSSDPSHPAGFAYMKKGMKECGYTDEELAQLKMPSSEKNI